MQEVFAELAWLAQSFSMMQLLIQLDADPNLASPPSSSTSALSILQRSEFWDSSFIQDSAASDRCSH